MCLTGVLSLPNMYMYSDVVMSIYAASILSLPVQVYNYNVQQMKRCGILCRWQTMHEMQMCV